MEMRNFDIPEQSLPDALPLFSEQAGMQVSVRGDLVRDVSTSGVSGSMRADTALRQLLAGTGLAYEITDEGAVIFEQAENPDSGMMLDTITVETTNFADEFFGAADRANSIYIGQQDLERRNPSTMRDVYAGESSVSVGGAIPASQKVYVNGIEENNLAVTLDGSSQNNTVFHHNGNNLIDPSLLKQVRVEPGVASADSGPAALGGAIVYETVDVDDVLAPDRSIGGFATSSFNTNGNVFTNGISAYGRAEGFEALGYFKYGIGDDYDAGNGDRVYGTETDFFSYLTKAAYESDSGHRVELSAQETHDDADRPYRANIGRLIGNPAPVVREYNLKSRNYVFNYSMPEAAGLWDPEVVFSYSDSEIGVPEPYGSVGTTGGFSGKVENDFNFEGDNTVTVGSDFYDKTARYKDPTYDAEEQATNVGMYAQARLELLEPLRLSFGGRVDHQWFEGVDGSDFENIGLSGNISAAFDVTDYLTLRAGYSNIWGHCPCREFHHEPGLELWRRHRPRPCRKLHCRVRDRP
ncbi:TonB-dependent receptor [Fodinicurvata halophila]|uniref:TonB-dependent receptor n=1 Tax=Fodinicurvata halophila TaxID=1419723 RepID=UPI00363815FE